MKIGSPAYFENALQKIYNSNRSRNPNYKISTEAKFNYENYYVYKDLVITGKIFINAKDINKNTWRQHYSAIYSILCDGIEQKIVQSAIVTVHFDKYNMNINLSIPDYYMNLMMWYILVFSDTEIQPGHLVFEKEFTKNTIKKYMDKYINASLVLTTEENYIVQGKSAMAFLLSNYYGVYCTALGDELGMAMLPKMDDGEKSGMYLNSNMYWCISSNCTQPEVAAAALNYMINSTDAAAVIKTDRGISLSSEVRNFLATSKDTDAYTANVLNYVSDVSGVVAAVNPADPAHSAEPISVLKNDYTAVMYGEMTAEDCVADFVEQATALLPN